VEDISLQIHIEDMSNRLLVAEPSDEVQVEGELLPIGGRFQQLNFGTLQLLNID
jgi:hypothetical protein